MTLTILYVSVGLAGGTGIQFIDAQRERVTAALLVLVLAPTLVISRLKARAFTRRVAAGMPPMDAVARSYRFGITDGWSGTTDEDCWYTLERGRAVSAPEPGQGAQRQHQIASLTKVFTAVALCDLVARREIALDDPLSRFGYEGGLGDVTLIELATHTSGLPRLLTSPLLVPRLVLRRPDPYFGMDLNAQRLRTAAKSVSSRRRGKDFYSNLGFDLLGNVLSRVEDREFGQVIADHVITPLGMRHTGETGAHLAEVTHVRAHDGWGVRTPMWSGLTGSGGLSSTSTDLRLLLRAFLDPDATDLAPAIRMSLEFEAQDRCGTILGLPWSRHGAVLWHSGMTYGETAMMALNPHTGRAALALTDQVMAFGTVRGCFALLD